MHYGCELARGGDAHMELPAGRKEDMMDYQTYLLAANIAIWLGVGGYLAFLAAQQRRLNTRIRQMEQLSDG
ncbi:CcmD family protein [Desulfovibrio ferrophilus]